MLQAQSLSVIGAGSYGTALAMAVASKGLSVCLYDHNPQRATAMEQARENQQYLPEIRFPDSLHVVSSLEQTIEFSPHILLVVPSSAFCSVLKSIKPMLMPQHRLAWATKGLESESGMLLSKVVEQEFASTCPPPMAALSGPTFARELALGLPTAIACAGNNDAWVSSLCELMHTPTFRVYKSHDIVALQLGGAIKNVIAIGAGMSDGLGYGANARTALISRGLVEMIRLGVSLGASEHGFMGLSGLGDLMLTCTDNQSRNRRFGFMLGQGKTAQDALANINQVVEGYHMVGVINKLAQRLNVDMPICREINAVLAEGKSCRDCAQTLLARALTTEQFFKKMLDIIGYRVGLKLDGGYLNRLEKLGKGYSAL